MKQMAVCDPSMVPVGFITYTLQELCLFVCSYYNYTSRVSKTIVWIN